MATTLQYRKFVVVHGQLRSIGLIGAPIDFLGNPRVALWTVIGGEI